MRPTVPNLLCLVAVMAAVIPASLQQSSNTTSNSTQNQFKTIHTIRIAFVFMPNDQPNPQSCMVEKFYKQMAAAATAKSSSACYNNLITSYWSIPVPLSSDNISSLLGEIQAFNATIIVGSNNFLVNDIAAYLGIPNFQIYQLPLSKWAASGSGITNDLLSATIRRLSDTTYFQFINNIYYYIAYGSQSTATYSAIVPHYGPNNNIPYLSYNNSIAEQLAVQASILQSNSLPYNGSIILMYDVSLDFSFVEALLNSWSTRYQTDRRFYLKMVDITFASGKSQETVTIVNKTVSSSSINTLFMVYTTLTSADMMLGIINTGNFLSTTSTQQQIYWNFINITLLSGVKIPIQALIFHWEFIQKSYQQIISDGYCTQQTAAYTMWQCLLDYDFASWLFQASQQDCAAELKTTNTTTPAQLYNILMSAFANTTTSGYTGKMEFNSNGVRIAFSTSLHIGLEQYDQTTMFCNYTLSSVGSFAPSCSTTTLPKVQNTVNGMRQVTVVTYNLPPFYYIQNGVQRGINVDMIKQIATLLNLNVTIVSADIIGTQDPITLKWSGLIGQLVYLQADFAVAALPVTSTYQSVVQYSSIYMEEQWSMLMARPDMVNFLGGFLRIFLPFDYIAWIMVVAAITISTATLTALDYLIPNSIAFDVSRSFYFTTGRAIQGMAGASPDAGSSRILVIYWSFNCLIIMQSYVANMAALLLYAQRVKTSITSPSTIIPNNYVPAGMANSPTSTYYSTTTSYEDSLLWTGGMSSNLITTASQVLQKLDNGSYVYIGQLDTNNYLAQKNPCYNSISSFGGETYALATPIGVNQVTIQELNGALQQMTTSGTLQQIIANYTQIVSTKAPSTCNADVSWTLYFGESETTILDTVKMSGLFLIMGGGCVISLLLAIGERFSMMIDKYRREKKAKKEASKKKTRTRPRTDDVSYFTE